MKKLMLALVWVASLTGTVAAVEIPASLRDAIITDIGRTLRDPYSAQYEFVIQNEFTVCGYVNAKNLMGAYVGRQPFSALYFEQAGHYHVVANVFDNNTDMSGMCG